VTDESIPGWAQSLIEKVTILNERLPNHIDTTNAAIADHEARIRAGEQTAAQLAALASAQVKLDEALIEVFGRLRNLEKKLWTAVGALSFLAFVAGTIGFNINLNG
jgi:hypothetical protein